MKLLAEASQADTKQRPLLTMDPPCYIDVEESQEQYHRAEHESNDTFEPEHPGGPVERRLLEGKGAVASGAVFGFDVRAKCRFGGN